MKGLILSVVLLLLLAGSETSMAQEKSAAAGATEKLGILAGRWQVQGTNNASGSILGGKTNATMECRWAPQGHDYMVCELAVEGPTGTHRQLSIYSYNAKEGSYSVVAIPVPGGKPSSGNTLTIAGNVWTISTTIQNVGKPRQVRTTTEYVDANTAKQKTEISDDGGGHWTLLVQAMERKTAD